MLNVLNFRNRGNLKITGDVKINGQVVNSPTALASISGYVQQVSQVFDLNLKSNFLSKAILYFIFSQEDLFVGTLKVKEQLKFQVLVRLIYLK